MTDAYIVDAARTPVGRFRGSLAPIRADHLLAAVLAELVTRNALPGEAVDDVIAGCVTQIGEQSANIARTALLGAGLAATVPGLTVDRKCGSSESAIHVGAAMIRAGVADVILAGGAENMSRVPIGSNRAIHGEAFGHAVLDRYEMTSQGESAERIAELYGLSREALDAYSVESHRRAGSAADTGYFEREIITVSPETWAERDAETPPALTADETIRRGTSAEKLATLKTAFRPEGRITAGNASQISDGASAVLLMSDRALQRYGATPRARIRAMTTVGSDPTLMLTGPLAATPKVLAQAGLSLADIDLFEVNEAFAPVPMMWLNEIGADPGRLNVNGGAIALGHPLGASGARIMTTLLHELERRGAQFGLQTVCGAGGLGTATVIERI